jgi:tRNA U55 pseudouridine synthase TruB
MHHESKLEAAAASVSEWNTKIRKLREDIAKADATLAESRHLRQTHVLEAALGDSAAKENLATVLVDDRKAERELEDLSLALPLAESELRTAEGAHRIAETEFRRSEVERLSRSRVEEAAAIDRAFADFSKAWSKYESLGHELLGLASESGSNALYLAETISGEARLVASLPRNPFLAIKEKFPFMAVSTHKSLADAERSYWRLPPIESETKAA